MIGPETAARWLLASLTVGLILGVLYGFLRPLRPKHTALSDLIFVLAAFYGWIFVGFQVCGGDIRFGCAAAMAAGGLLWEMTAGRLLRPLFRKFWGIISKIAVFSSVPGKYFCKKPKNYANCYWHPGKNGLQ